MVNVFKMCILNHSLLLVLLIKINNNKYKCIALGDTWNNPNGICFVCTKIRFHNHNPDLFGNLYNENSIYYIPSATFNQTSENLFIYYGDVCPHKVFPKVKIL